MNVTTGTVFDQSLTRFEDTRHKIMKSAYIGLCDLYLPANTHGLVELVYGQFVGT